VRFNLGERWLFSYEEYSKSGEKMEIQNQGGRPPKKHKRDQQLSTQVTLLERKILATKAEKAQLTISEYLRIQGIQGNVKVVSLPIEVLQIKGTLNHTAANINQIAYKLNALGVIRSVELTGLEVLVEEIKSAVTLINIYCK
jgi:hypothetical protein